MKWIGISNSTTKITSRGFSLTELAIVLAVTSIILGSVWAFVSQGWESAHQEKLKNEIFATVKNMRAFAAAKNGVSGTFATLTTIALAEHIISSNMTRTGGYCNFTPNVCADTPWGATTMAMEQTGSFGVCPWTAGTSTNCTTGGTNTQLFAVEVQGLERNSCVNAVMKNSGSEIAGLYDVVINDTSMLAAGSLPPALSAVRAACTNSATIDFVYRVVQAQN
jgi:prepilin-type N-terminal cleavage/methylation domain-containing protein